MFDQCNRNGFFKAIIVAIVVAGFSFAASAAGDFKNDFEQANQQYDQGKYEAAEKLYKSVIDGGNYSLEVFYNLGNAEFRLKKTGGAILNYERALALAPNNPEVRANLALVRDQTGANVPAKGWRDRIVADLGVNTYCWIAAGAAWMGIFAFAAIVLRRHSENFASWSLVLLSLAVFAYAGFAIYQLEQDRFVAIVMSKAEARFAPADNSTLAATLPAGSRVWILERRGPWVYCTLPDSNRAWISSDAIERVRLKDS